MAVGEKKLSVHCAFEELSISEYIYTNYYLLTNSPRNQPAPARSCVSARRPAYCFKLQRTPHSRDKPMRETSSYAVGWGTLALINAGLAQSRRRSGLNWFILTLLLGPIATFLLVAFFNQPAD